MKKVNGKIGKALQQAGAPVDLIKKLDLTRHQIAEAGVCPHGCICVVASLEGGGYCDVYVYRNDDCDCDFSTFGAPGTTEGWGKVNWICGWNGVNYYLLESYADEWLGAVLRKFYISSSSGWLRHCHQELALWELHNTGYVGSNKGYNVKKNYDAWVKEM